ncbi:MAG: hypothetical protein KKD86_19075 [Bacteroidetes bacterium]|nr:hypothetical protein [Bacteroidota bacterium]
MLSLNMNSSFYKLLISALLLLIVSDYSFGQDSADTKTVSVEIKSVISLQHGYQLPENFVTEEFVNLMSDWDYVTSMMSYETSEDNKNSLQFDMELVKAQLIKNMNQKVAWQAKYDLGAFGKYLGMAMTASAVGLAAAHVAKYKGKAFFKRK